MSHQTSNQLNLQMCPAPNDQGHTELHDAIAPDIAPEEETELSSAMPSEALHSDSPDESADEFDGLDEDSPLRRWPVARRRLFSIYPESNCSDLTDLPPTFDSLNYDEEARKFEVFGDGHTTLCFALIESRDDWIGPFRMLMVHPYHIELSDAAFRIFNQNDDELEVRYTRSAKYISIHAQDGAFASVWLKWDGSLIEAKSRESNGNASNSGPQMALQLAQMLCCLDLLTPEIESALKISILKAVKKSWKSGFKKRLR